MSENILERAEEIKAALHLYGTIGIYHLERSEAQDALALIDAQAVRIKELEAKAQEDAVTIQALRNAANGFKAEAQTPKWVSVKERLPDEKRSGGLVLAMDTDGIVHEALCCGGSWLFHYVEETSTQITHWMQRPSPPEKESADE